MQFAVKLSIVLLCLFCSFILCRYLLILQGEVSMSTRGTQKTLKLPLWNSLLFAGVRTSEIILAAF